MGLILYCLEEEHVGGIFLSSSSPGTEIRSCFYSWPGVPRKNRNLLEDFNVPGFPSLKFSFFPHSTSAVDLGQR